MTYIAIFLISIIIFSILRAIFLFVNQPYLRQGIIGDSSVHYSTIKQLKKSFWSLYVDQYVMTQGPMIRPRAFHRFAMLFPLKTLRRWPSLPNFILYVFFSAGYFTLLYYLQVNLFSIQNIIFLVIAAVFYFFTISNMVFFGPAISYIHLTPRLLARLSTGSAYFFLCTYLLWNWRPSFLLSILAAILAWHAAAFSRQVVLFTWPLLSLCFWRWEPTIAMLASLALAFLIAPKYFAYSLEHTFRYWKIFKDLNKLSASVQSGISKFLSFKRMRASLVTRDVKAIIREIFFREPTRTLIFYAELLLLLLFLFMQGENADWRLALPLLPTAIVWIATSTDRFNHLGEAYRYFEYNLVFYLPLALTLAIFPLIDSRPTQLILGIFWGFVLLVTLLSYWMVARFKEYAETDNLTEFLSHIPLTEKDVVFPISMRLGADICARAECKSFWWQPGGITDPVLYKKFIGEYPYLHQEWKRFIQPYHVTHVIYEKAEYAKAPWEYDFSGLDLIYEDELYIALRVPAQLREAEHE